MKGSDFFSKFKVILTLIGMFWTLNRIHFSWPPTFLLEEAEQVRDNLSACLSTNMFGGVYASLFWSPTYIIILEIIKREIWLQSIQRARETLDQLFVLYNFHQIFRFS